MKKHEKTLWESNMATGSPQFQQANTHKVWILTNGLITCDYQGRVCET